MGSNDVQLCLSNSASRSEPIARNGDLYPRYEALIDLAHRARRRTSIEDLAGCIANGWRFCANAVRWRVIVESDSGVQVIDYDGAKIDIRDIILAQLPPADLKFWRQHIPAHLRYKQIQQSSYIFADHLKCEHVHDIVVLTLDAEGRGHRIMALICSGEPGFSATDLKFVEAVGDMFASELSYILTVTRLTRTLQQQAHQDVLTGIPNRRSFEERFDIYWRDSARMGEPLTLLFVDIDYFKRYNDTYGHLMGDGCIRIIATVLRDCIQRPLDFCARIGGEEFAILLPATNPAGAAIVGYRLLKAVRALAVEHTGNSEHNNTISISIGAASMIATPSRAPTALMEAADTALYAAKNSGRNRYCQSAIDHPSLASADSVL